MLLALCIVFFGIDIALTSHGRPAPLRKEPLMVNIATLAQALAALTELPGGGSADEDPRAAVAAEADAVPALIAAMLGQQPPRPQGPPGSATGPPAGDLAGHTGLLLRRCATIMAALQQWRKTANAPLQYQQAMSPEPVHAVTCVLAGGVALHVNMAPSARALWEDVSSKRAQRRRGLL